MAEKSQTADAGGSDLRMVLLGVTGSGRSSAGNTLLGRSAFWTDTSSVSVTSRCQRAGGVTEGRSLQVIDTPGFFHTCLSPEEVRVELSRSMDLLTPGPHVFVLVLRPCRLTPEQCASLHCTRATFGPHVLTHTIVLLTCGDTLGSKPPEDFLKESSELWEFVSECAGGFHVFDNTKAHEDRSQVSELLQKVDLLVERNEGSHYTADMLLQAQADILQIQQRILGEGAGPVAGGRSQDAEEEGESRRRAERVFWYELLTAVGRGAVEASGVMEKGKGKGKKVKTVQRVAAIAATPLSINTAAKVVGGAMREGAKILDKHKKTFLR